MPAPPTDALLMGWQMDDELCPQPDGFHVEKWSLNADPENPQVAIRVTRKFLCRSDVAEDLAIPFLTAHAAPYDDCFLNRALFEQTEGGGGFWSAIYENALAQSVPIEVSIGQTVVELDVGLEQMALELAPRFAGPIASATITLNDLVAINYLRRGDYIHNAYGANAHVSDNGSTLKFKCKNAEGVTVELSIAGADTPTNAQGTARELALEVLRGRESVDMITAQFHKTSGWNTDHFTTIIASANKLEYPGYGLPGTAVNWKRGATTAFLRAGIREERITWDFSDYGWDQRYYPFL